MATVRFYMTRLRAFQRAIGRKMGVDLRSEPKSVRVLAATNTAALGVLLKLLVDKGIVTDAELAAAFNLTEADSYDDEPLEPPPLPEP